MPMQRSTLHDRLLSHGLMLASGFAGLGYQMAWTQQASLWLGHESAGVLAVIAAFFGGLALGAFAGGPRIERSSRPWRWYAGCEAVIGLWGLVLMAAMAPASQALLTLTGAQPSPLWQWCVAFGGTLVLLLPATAAMGATLPAMDRLAQVWRNRSLSVAGLYASNTAGAVLGVLLSVGLLVPWLGLLRTSAVCVMLNLLCALAAWWTWERGATPQALPRPVPVAPAETAVPARLPASGWRLAVTGLLGIGYEVVVVRVLSQVTEDTVYTFALLLAVYLVGTASGAAAYQHWIGLRAADAARRPRWTDRLLGALALACLLGSTTLWGAEQVRQGVLSVTGPGMTPALATESLLALLAFGLPTLVMGALFSHLTVCARAEGLSLGRSLGLNTLGAAAAPALFGVLLAPWLGPKTTLLLLAPGYLALTGRASRWSAWTWVPAVAALLLAVLMPPLAFVDIPEGGRLVRYEEGAMAAVSVVADSEGVLRLRINNRQQEGSSHTRLVDGRQALLPLLLHPQPHTALFLGLGTGVTASVAAEEAGLQVQAVELLPEVIRASALFRDGAEADLPRLQVLASDARRHVRTSHPPVDVIVSDNFHPARSGSGALYTVEHFQAVRSRLNPEGGLFCQWLPLHQLDIDTLRSIVRSFLVAFPQGSALLASNSLATPVLGLVGRADDTPFELAQVSVRLARQRFAQAPAEFGLPDEFAVLGSFVAGPVALARLAGQVPANTDDHPVVAYRAPRITYAPDSTPGERLIVLLRELSASGVADTTPPLGSPDPAALARLAAYRQARNRFIEAGRDVRPGGTLQAMLAQVQAPLLDVLRISPDFRPAREPLERMAQALQAENPAAASRLQDALARLQAARTP